jgi:hypothetical protein
MNKFLSLFIFSIMAVSCNTEEDYLIHEKLTEQPRTDKTVDIRDFLEPSVDILFVVDNSGSMGGIQDNIVKNSKIFMEEFLKTNFLKWRMGIISTDKDQEPFLGFETIFNEESLAPIQKFSNAINALGTNGDYKEYVFYNTLRHLTNPKFSFVRRHAHLAIIMVTDEKEQSEKDFGAQFEALTFINSLKSLKNTERITRFYGAFDYNDLASCKAGDVYKGSPFETVINETGGIYMSACTADFGKKLARIGKDIVEFVDSPSITLNTRPIISTIEVFFNDKLLKGGAREDGGVWYYDKYFNTINFYSMSFSSDDEESNIRITFDNNDGVDRS